MSEGLVLPGKPERALRHAFTPKFGGPPDFRYCQGAFPSLCASCCPELTPSGVGRELQLQ
jgi:hypothetical protein